MNAAGAAVSIEWKRAVIVSDNLPHRPPPPRPNLCTATQSRARLCHLIATKFSLISVATYLKANTDFCRAPHE